MTKTKVIPIRCKGGELVRLEELEPFQGTLKVLTKQQGAKIRGAIETYGFRFPVFFWENKGKKYTLDGHQRIQILEQMLKEGWTLEGGKIPADRVEASSVKEAKEILLLAASSYARTDPEGLYEYLMTAGLDFQQLSGLVELPGIDADRFTAGYLTDAPNEDDPVEAAKETRTQPGDLWQLGNHRILCGDARDNEAYSTLLQGEKADLVFTDPPYNVDYQGKGKNTSTSIVGDNSTEQDFRDLLTAAFLNCQRHTTTNAPLYCCHASRTHREFEDALNSGGFFVRNQIIWVKMIAAFGWGDYRWKHEPIFYAAKKDGRLPFFGDRSQYTVWEEQLSDPELLQTVKRMIAKEEQGDSTIWRLARENSYDHPTQKPVKLVGIALKNSTKAGNLILDPFAGAGTTLIAAEQMNRRARLLEIDPRWIDATIARWERLTGRTGEARRIAPGTASDGATTAEPRRDTPARIPAHKRNAARKRAKKQPR